MPNWCNNKLVVSGPYEDVSKFVYAISYDEDGNKRDQTSLLESHIPLSDESSNGDWYSQAIELWGTKWDVNPVIYDTEEDAGVTSYFFSYDSAWNPPMNGIVGLSKMYPTLLFYNDYMEPGMGFMGAFKVMNGTILYRAEVEMYECIEMYRDNGMTWAYQDALDSMALENEVKDKTFNV